MSNGATVTLTPEDIERWRARIRLDTDLNYLYCMGLALERSGTPAEAETMISQALARDARFAGARAAGIRLARQRGDTALAARLEKDGLDLDPDFPLAAPLDLLRDIGNRPEALSDLLPQIRTAVTNARTPSLRHRAREALVETLETLGHEAMARGDNATALHHLQEALSVAQEPSAALLSTVAESYYRQGDLARASELITKAWLISSAAGLENETYRTGFSAISILRADLRLTDALAICDSLLTRYPADTDLAIRKALLLISTQHAAQACLLLQEAAASQPASAEAHVYLSIAFAAAGDIERAIDTGRQATALDSAGTLPRVALGLALALKGQREGLEMLRGVNASDAANQFSLTAEAAALWKTGDEAAAGEVLNQALTLTFPRGNGRKIDFMLRLFPYAAPFFDRAGKSPD